MSLRSDKLANEVSAIVTSDKAYLRFRKTLHDLSNQDKVTFIDILLDEFETHRLHESFNYFVENVLSAKVEEIHQIMASREEDKHWHNYAQQFANDEWIERQGKALEKIRKEAQEYKDSGYKLLTMTPEKVNPLPFDEKKVRLFRLTLFKRMLIDGKFISSNTSIKQVEQLFGINNNYAHEGHPTEVKKPICWTGSNYALKLLIDILEREKIIVFKQSKWKHVAPWFLDSKTQEVYKPVQLSSARNTMNQKREGEDKLIAAIKILKKNKEQL
jgi:hypothetical protein